jgi:hypothetical protein
MLELFGKHYIIDIEEVTNACKTGNKTQDDDGNDTYEINIFKYELLKLCVERILNEYEKEDSELAGYNSNNDVSLSFKLAFNTLIKNNIIIEDETFDI